MVWWRPGQICNDLLISINLEIIQNFPPSGYPQLRGGAERILSQRLRAGPGLQLLQGLKKYSEKKY